jgi:hypothetical protein
VLQWESDHISIYPEIIIFIDRLKNKIKQNPENGSPDEYLSVSGKKVPFRKQSVNVNLFSHQYALGYNFITASYLYNDDLIYVFNMAFS